MKKSIVVLLMAVVITACKKKSEPSPEPEPTPPPVCVQGKTKVFAEGKYYFSEGNHDTVEVVFISTYCPNQDANKYLIKGIGKALNSIKSSPPNHTFTVDEYFVSSETNKKAGAINDDYEITVQSTGAIVINCSQTQPIYSALEKLQ